jgi:hypothetical protein
MRGREVLSDREIVKDWVTSEKPAWW